MATIVDVAEYAGVSVATVSRMMNSPDVVSEKTKKKIHKAITGNCIISLMPWQEHFSRKRVILLD